MNIEELKIIYSDDEIEVAETGRDYDFIAVVENKTTEVIRITPDIEETFEPFEITPCDWVGILADDEGRNFVEAIKRGKFYQEFVY